MELRISESELRPELISCRFFDSHSENPTAGRRTKSRVTGCYEFSFYTSDGGALFLDSTQYPIRSGVWRFVPPGLTISSIPHYTCYTVNFSLHPDPDKIPVRCRNPFLDAIPVYFESRNQERFVPLMERIIRQSFEADTGSSITMKALLCELLSLIYTDISGAVPQDSAAENAVLQAQAYLAENFKNELSLETLGSMYGYHPLYFQRIFKQAAGKTPHEYLTYLRLRHARELLTTTSLPVWRIAIECGYSSVSHFNSIFKRQSGGTPLAYRKKNQIIP